MKNGTNTGRATHDNNYSENHLAHAINIEATAAINFKELVLSSFIITVREFVLAYLKVKKAGDFDKSFRWKLRGWMILLLLLMPVCLMIKAYINTTSIKLYDHPSIL